MKHRFLFILINISIACFSTVTASKPINLKTEYLTNPIGIDTQYPRFTWEFADGKEPIEAYSYVIKIGTDKDNLRPYQDIKLRPHTKYVWNVTVFGKGKKQGCTSALSTFETGKFTTDDWNGKWITDKHPKEFEPAPMFRKTFSAGSKKIKEARLYIAAAGYYEAFMNNKRVGDNYLDPGYTHFNKRILYVTHNITKLITAQKNSIAIVLGNGWYNEQSIAVWNFHQANWRNRPGMLAEIRITYTDDTTDIISTDQTWRTNTGAYLYNNLYSGDVYDARLEDDWKSNTYNDQEWDYAQTVKQPTEKIVAQQMPGIRITQEIKPISYKKISGKKYVFTFPKNIAGFCQFRVKGEAGTKVMLKYGELLNAKGELEQGNINVYYHPVQEKEHFQTDVYILKGSNRVETFTPSFTYHGFQYVEVESSKDLTLNANSLTALFVHTDLKSVGSFRSSSSLLNKIWNATMQSYRSNIHSIPTDCPQREKNGWTADAHIAIDLGLLGFEGITFYEKWMNDFIDNQRESGEIAGIVPSSGWGYGEWPGPVWDAALFIIPNTLYNYYGSTKCIESLYPTLLRYLEYLRGKEKDGIITFGLGDWVFWKATTNSEYTSTAYYYYDHLLMARFATLLKKDPTPFLQKAELLREKINTKFYRREQGIYADGTQTAQALALYLKLVPNGDEEKVAARLQQKVAESNHSLDFGLIGSKTVLSMLTQYGYVEDAMKMMTKTSAPSWGYWVETLGYTTLPETWTLSPKFQDASLNHVFLGDVSAWMMNQLAGINYDVTQPGFQNIHITPHFVKDLEWVEGQYHSIAGLISSKWYKKGHEITLHLQIPVQCTATLTVNGTNQSLKGGSHTFHFTNKNSNK